MPVCFFITTATSVLFFEAGGLDGMVAQGGVANYGVADVHDCRAQNAERVGVGMVEAADKDESLELVC